MYNTTRLNRNYSRSIGIRREVCFTAEINCDAKRCKIDDKHSFPGLANIDCLKERIICENKLKGKNMNNIEKIKVKQKKGKLRNSKNSLYSEYLDTNFRVMRHDNNSTLSVHSYPSRKDKVSSSLSSLPKLMKQLSSVREYHNSIS